MHIFSGPFTPPGEDPSPGDLVSARFSSRPNRFLVLAETASGLVRAHCPNPGRLWEVFTPGAPLILQYSGNPERSTPYSLVAAEYQGKYLPLYAAGANKITEKLILPRLFPDALEVRKEVTVGGSRFDFEFYRPPSEGGRRILLEVKACTLTEEGLAMFPDAPTERGRRHMEELAELARRGEAEGHIVFVLHHPDTRAFMPNFHTDPAFALAMAELSPHLTFHAVSVASDRTGKVSLVDADLPVLPAPAAPVRENRGVYMILLERKKEEVLEVGALGKRNFPPGWYVYVGGARNNLTQTMNRHLRKKRARTVGPPSQGISLDYLVAGSEKRKGIPIYTENDLECSLAQAVAETAEREIPGFGCADGGGSSHLFHFTRPPLTVKPFVDIIFRYRHRLCFENPLAFQNLED